MIKSPAQPIPIFFIIFYLPTRPQAKTPADNMIFIIYFIIIRWGSRRGNIGGDVIPPVQEDRDRRRGAAEREA